MTTVRELMHTDLVTVSPDTNLHDLARIFSNNDISGTPVLDSTGGVVGVVSQTDLIRFAAEEIGVSVHRETEASIPSDWTETGAEEDDEDEEEEEDPSALPQFQASDLDDYVVENIMTAANFHVTPDTTVPELARFLLKGRIHRALVMEDGELQGIVTTVDLLKTLAKD